MSRQKISEYRAKKIIADALNVSYVGWEVRPGVRHADLGMATYHMDGLDLVVKVDQAVKGRFKKGLVLLNIEKGGVDAAINQLEARGYNSFLVEPQVAHEAAGERYLALTLEREGVKLAWSDKGGIDIESYRESIQSVPIGNTTDWSALARSLGFTESQLRSLCGMFQREHMTFLEINPYIITEDGVAVLDCAIEVDGAGEYFTSAWSEADVRFPKIGRLSDEERQVRQLDTKSPASFNLSVLNPDGGVFLLLSGGGASVVVADEVYSQGFGKELANYGEYSGNPSPDETEQYTRAVLNLLLRSKSEKKVLFIGGAVANFTDIASTFTGVIAAIDVVAEQLLDQGVKVFVRRGGPRQEVGLARIEACLQRHGILGSVHTPDTALTDVIGLALKEVK